MAAMHALSVVAPAPLGRWFAGMNLCVLDAAASFCTTGDLAAALTHGFGRPLLRALRP